ncbi:MAG: sulfurtransferase TusA family protein [Halobacteria archaeon]|nr:sulfurtransferase TusA family protein [Halobacteria archaeon]
MTETMDETVGTADIDSVEPRRTVDNRGVGCANGIVKVKRALEDLSDGDVLEILSTDRRAKKEYPRLADETPHELISIDETGLVRKKYTVLLRIRSDGGAADEE